MLAEEEYIFDVILAKMWDKFEEFEKEMKHTSTYQMLAIKDIKQAFIKIRKAYQVLQERDANKGSLKDKDMPVPSVLHELAASMNLRNEMQVLVDQYLSLFKKDNKESYLVVAIDDIDMSGKKAHHILEQIRRFLRIHRVIVLLTADIERLQKGCEYRYLEIYKDRNDRYQFVNDYLEKVLPYNMRVYMPEFICLS